MAFDFSEINISDNLNIDYISICCQTLNKIVEDKNKEHQQFFQLFHVTYKDDDPNTKYIEYNKTIEDFKENMGQWLPFFERYIDKLSIIAYLICNQPIFIKDTHCVSYTSSCHQRFHLNPSEATKDLIWNPQMPIVDNYEKVVKQNNLSPYLTKDDKKTFTISDVKINFNNLYNVLYTTYIMNMLISNSNSVYMNLDLLTCESIPIINITNSLHEILEFIYKIGNSKNSFIFKKVQLYHFFDNIKFNIIKLNILDTNDLAEFDKILSDTQYIYNICVNLINSGIIKKLHQYNETNSNFK